MSSWLCSSGSRPISFCYSKYRQGRLPDEHNQLDTLYVDATLDVMHCNEKSSPNLYKSYLFHEKSQDLRMNKCIKWFYFTNKWNISVRNYDVELFDGMFVIVARCL